MSEPELSRRGSFSEQVLAGNKWRERLNSTNKSKTEQDVLSRIDDLLGKRLTLALVRDSLALLTNKFEILEGNFNEKLQKII